MKSTIQTLPLTLPDLSKAYADGLRPEAVVAEIYRRIMEADDPGIFLHLRPCSDVEDEARRLGEPRPDMPLWGIPFAIKDNIDLASVPTTAACPAFTYTAEADAFVVARLRAAGALVIGKANLDQFATGLVGVRTPYPVPKNAIDPGIVPGGSSSGSAVAVARGLVAFALGTDTAGSGRVPAALNNIVGLKPTLGALSATGVVPACKTLDTISIFALTVDDAYAVYRQAAAYDPSDPYSHDVPVHSSPGRPPMLKIGIPSEATRNFDGDLVQGRSFDADVAVLSELGADIVEIDMAPFLRVAQLLYTGAWIAERETVVAKFLANDPDALHPVTRQIIGQARNLSAADAFRDFYQLAALKREVEPILASVDFLCVPSIPRFVSVEEIDADPIGPNALLGTYTNFVNLLDLCALTVPTSPREDGRPGSVTLISRAGTDARLAAIGRDLERRAPRSLGATTWSLPPAVQFIEEVAPDELEIVVCGAHMSGLPLNHELTRRGGRFVRTTQTAAVYRLYVLPGGPPMRPGLVRAPDGDGGAIEVEVWTLPRHEIGGFLAGIPSPLGLGRIMLSDGESAIGFLCEAAASGDAEDVTFLESWRRVVAREPGTTGAAAVTPAHRG